VPSDALQGPAKMAGHRAPSDRSRACCKTTAAAR
jgi:hypothetical protein